MNISTVSQRAAQRGATLVVGLIMLVLITVMVTSAFTLSSSNLKSVGNMQARDEAIAAGNRAIEQISASPFTDDPVAEEINVDIDTDGAPDTNEHGHAFTVAYLFEFWRRHRLGFEYSTVDSDRAGVPENPGDDGWQVSYRFRY